MECEREEEDREGPVFEEGGHIGSFYIIQILYMIHIHPHTYACTVEPPYQDTTEPPYQDTTEPPYQDTTELRTSP